MTENDTNTNEQPGRWFDDPREFAEWMVARLRAEDKVAEDEMGYRTTDEVEPDFLAKVRTRLNLDSGQAAVDLNDPAVFAGFIIGAYLADDVWSSNVGAHPLAATFGLGASAKLLTAAAVLTAADVYGIRPRERLVADADADAQASWEEHLKVCPHHGEGGHDDDSPLAGVVPIGLPSASADDDEDTGPPPYGMYL